MIKTAFSIFISALVISGAVVAKSKPAPKVAPPEDDMMVNLPLELITVPSNIRSDADLILTLRGEQTESCFKLKGGKFENPNPHQHRISMQAQELPGDCNPVKKKFTEKLNIGQLEPGVHFLTFERADGSEKTLKFQVKGPAQE